MDTQNYAFVTQHFTEEEVTLNEIPDCTMDVRQENVRNATRSPLSWLEQDEPGAPVRTKSENGFEFDGRYLEAMIEYECHFAVEPFPTKVGRKSLGKYTLSPSKKRVVHNYIDDFDYDNLFPDIPAVENEEAGAGNLFPDIPAVENEEAGVGRSSDP